MLARLEASFAAIGDVQFLPGYSVLLTDDPTVERLSDLPRHRRRAYLDELDLLAETVEDTCRALDGAFLRVNIEILGNTDPFLHTHIWPRYAWEDTDLRRLPVWLYPPTRWSDPVFALGPQHDPWRAGVTARLGESQALGGRQ